MPRKPRIDLAGYHHVINRGVNYSDIFKSDEDYEMFLKIVCKACRAYRLYSRYINGDDYYYTLIQYIEQNPIEAVIVKQIGEYPYTLSSVIANKNTPVPCALKSKLVEELTCENMQDMISVKLDTKALEIFDEIDKQKVLSQDGRKRPAHSKELKEYFEDADTKPKRDSTIIKCDRRWLYTSRSCKAFENVTVKYLQNSKKCIFNAWPVAL